MYKGFIYRYTNRNNGKSYIGKTKNLSNRVYQHSKITILKKTKFGNAIRKYGIECFELDILEIIESKNIRNLDKSLNVLEKYYIKHFDSYSNGYNSTKGGDGTLYFKHSEETKNKMRNKIVSKETRSKLSKASKGRKIHSPKTDNWRKSIKEAKSIPILQYSKDNTFIKEWSSITEAARYYNISKSCIARVCNGERKNSKNFFWRYKHV